MTKAKIIESAEKFLEVLERSGLFAANQLDAIRKLAESSSDPMPIARALVKNGWLTKWQASQLLSGFYNLTVGKYRLADHLGRGELGNVYLAENPKLGRKVALKTLSKKHTESPQVVKCFLDEARAAAALDHRNIVHVHDVSSDGQRHYVVMEYVTGRDLQSRVDSEGPLDSEEAASVIRQAAEGLRYAHEQGVVHRDIKPANIMLDDQGVAKILDIGEGYLRSSATKPSENTGELMMSTLAYMAPEHARGEKIDARCDIYSLGGVLYFLLTGRTPFSTKTDAERARIKETKRPIPIGELRADSPSGLVELCDRMMALKPSDRIASMADVLTLLAGKRAVAAEVADDGAQQELEDVEPLEAAEGEEVALANESVAEVAAAEPATSEIEPEPDSQATPASKESSTGIKIDLGDSTKPAAASIPVDFAINTKRRKKKSATKSAPAAKAAAPTAAAESKPQPTTLSESDAAPADDQPAPVSKEAKKGLSKGLIIGGACAAGLLLVTGVGVGAMMFLGGDDQQVAQAPPAPASAPDADAATGTDDAAADPSEATSAAPEGDSETDVTAEPDTSATADPSAAAAPAAETPSAEMAGASAPAATEPAAAAGDVAAEQPVAPGTTTDTATPVSEPETASTDAAPEPAETEKPAEPPATSTPPTTPAEPAPEEKPAPVEKTPEKTAPPKPKTFNFAAAVDLPSPTSDAPELTLGQINIRPEDAVFISLDGGDIAAGGRFEFSVQNAQDGVAPRDWEFYLSDGSSDPVVIATMSMPEKDLKFKWTQAGIENPTATNLRNCSLRITAGQDQPQDLALRMPQKIAPVTIDVEKAATAKLPLEGAPDRSSLKMEVSVKNHKYMVEPAQIELSKGGEAVIYFGENQEQAALALKLDASLNARGVQVKTEPYFLVPVEKSPVRLNKAAIKKYEAAQAQQAGLQSQIFEGQKAVNDNKLSPQDKARGQALLAGMKQQLELIDKTVAKMAQLSTDMAAIGSGASLQFRVFSDTFEKQIDLIVTDPNAAPVAP